MSTNCSIRDRMSSSILTRGTSSEHSKSAFRPGHVQPSHPVTEPRPRRSHRWNAHVPIPSIASCNAGLRHHGPFHKSRGSTFRGGNSGGIGVERGGRAKYRSVWGLVVGWSTVFKFLYSDVSNRGQVRVDGFLYTSQERITLILHILDGAAEEANLTTRASPRSQCRKSRGRGRSASFAK